MMRKRFLLLAFTSLLAVAAALAAERYEVTIERGVAVKMRDGVILRADIYRPNFVHLFPQNSNCYIFI